MQIEMSSGVIITCHDPGIQGYYFPAVDSNVLQPVSPPDKQPSTLPGASCPWKNKLQHVETDYT